MIDRRGFLASVFAVPVAGIPPTPPPATRYGVISATQGSEPDDAATFIKLYDRQRTKYGAPIGIRLFSGDRLPLPGDRGMCGQLLVWAQRHHSDELITVSHKDKADDDRLRAFLTWVQDHGLRASIIYYHEVQAGTVDLGDPRAHPDVYLRTYQDYRRVLAAHPARSRVTLEKNLMWHFQHYRAPREHRGDWHDYVETGDPADLVSWDCYAFRGMPAWLRRYATPDEFFRYALAVWREFGLPWGVGEIGSEVPAWDRGGAVFERWVRQITATAANPATIGPEYAGLPPARFMKWWAATDVDDHDLSLDQVPAAMRHYRELVRAAPPPG